MRVVLFRGKFIDDNKWVYGFYFVTDTTDYQDHNGNIQTKSHFIYCNNKAQRILTETVGQYTGKTDRTGKKIFEDDLVDVFNEKNEKIANKIKVEMSYFLGAHYSLHCVNGIELTYEIVGNIHENK